MASNSSSLELMKMVSELRRVQCRADPFESPKPDINTMYYVFQNGGHDKIKQREWNDFWEN